MPSPTVVFQFAETNEIKHCLHALGLLNPELEPTISDNLKLITDREMHLPSAMWNIANCLSQICHANHSAIRDIRQPRFRETVIQSFSKNLLGDDDRQRALQELDQQIRQYYSWILSPNK